MKTFYVQFVDRCWTPKKIGATCYSVLINSEHSTPVKKYLNTAHRFFKLLCGQNSINPKIFVVLFLSSCTKFSKNSNVSMCSRSRDERTSHKQESEKSAMIPTLVKSVENPICFQPIQRWRKLWTCSKRAQNPGYIQNMQPISWKKSTYTNIECNLTTHETRKHGLCTWQEEYTQREKWSANSAKTDDVRKPKKSTDV